jgi:hypothetical protein
MQRDYEEGTGEQFYREFFVGWFFVGTCACFYWTAAFREIKCGC